MEPPLQRLIDLWSASLESGLDEAAQREMDGLMADPGLVERLGEWQAQRSAAEAQAWGETPGLDRRVLAGFRRRVLLRRWLPWMAAGVLGLGALALLNGWGESRAQALGVAEEPVQDVVVAATAVPTARPASRSPLGPPPGFGQRPRRVLLHRGQPVELQVSLAQQGPLQVDVWDASGNHIRTLSTGVAGAGSHAQAWDGSGASGQPLPAGVYRMVATDGRRVLAQKQVELSPGP